MNKYQVSVVNTEEGKLDIMYLYANSKEDAWHIADIKLREYQRSNPSQYGGYEVSYNVPIILVENDCQLPDYYDKLIESGMTEDDFMDIYDYTYWGDYNERIKELADKALPEKWNFDGKTDYSILKNYMRNTFNKLQEENKVIETDSYCVFDTGLFANYYVPIYAYGEPNKNTSEDSRKWFFKGFKDKYELGALDSVERFPERADYFSDPSLLVFNWHLDVNINYKHILDNLNTSQRLPDHVKNSDIPSETLKGVVDTAVQRVIANYKLAVPHYYNNKIQLMIPLCFGSTDKPDVALVLDRMKNNYYQAATCLDMQMAYMDARIIAKPDSNWLTIQ